MLRDRDRPSGRLLLQDDMEASYVDLADPRHVGFDYLRRMRDVVELCGLERVLHVGGAGCALARALAAAHPDGRQEVVEADPAVLEIARAHLGLKRAPGLKVRVGDGRAAVAGRADASADAVLLDAFVGARVPRHLVTVEALADVARVLTPTGVAAINVVDVPPLHDVRAIAAGLRASFAHVVAVGPSPVLRARRGGNVVLLAAQRALPEDRLRVRAAADVSPAVLLDAAELAGLVAATAPWTDRA